MKIRQKDPLTLASTDLAVKNYSNVFTPFILDEVKGR